MEEKKDQNKVKVEWNTTEWRDDEVPKSIKEWKRRVKGEWDKKGVGKTNNEKGDGDKKELKGKKNKTKTGKRRQQSGALTDKGGKGWEWIFKMFWREWEEKGKEGKEQKRWNYRQAASKLGKKKMRGKRDKGE